MHWPRLCFALQYFPRTASSKEALTVGASDVMQDSHNLLRPETVESLYVLRIVTEKPHYQEWAWEIFRAFHMHSLVDTGGYSNLDSCLQVATYSLVLLAFSRSSML